MSSSRPKPIPNCRCGFLISVILGSFVFSACVPSGGPAGRIIGTLPEKAKDKTSDISFRADAGFISNLDAGKVTNYSDTGVTPVPPPPPPPYDGGQPMSGPMLIKLELAPATLTLKIGETLVLQAFATYDDNHTRPVRDNLSWQSLDSSIASINSSGLVTAITDGRTQVSANYKNFIARAEVEVAPNAPPQIISLTISPQTTNLSPGDTLQLTATANYNNGQTADVTNMTQWSSSDASIASINVQGLLTQHLEGQVSITAQHQSFQASVNFVGRSCEYPYGVYSVSKGAIIPNLQWMGVADETGQSMDFSMADFHCNPDFAQYNMVAFVVGTGWCPYCPAQMRRVGNQAAALRQAGGLVVYAEIQNSSRRPASSSYAVNAIDRMVGSAPGIRVGAAPNEEIADAPLINSYPNGFVVRKRDMRIIATHSAYNGSIPYTQITQDPERDWTQGELPVFSSRCSAGSDESYEPNNRPGQASSLSVTSFNGGICEEEPDFFRVNITGNWRVDLNFSHRDGDLDLYLWDETENRVAIDRRGEGIGSNSATDNESYSGSGPALIMIHGYRYASANYSLNLVELP